MLTHPLDRATQRIRRPVLYTYVQRRGYTDLVARLGGVADIVRSRGRWLPAERIAQCSPGAEQDSVASADTLTHKEQAALIWVSQHMHQSNPYIYFPTKSRITGIQQGADHHPRPAACLIAVATLAARAQGGVDALALPYAAMLALGFVASRPEREHAQRLILGAQGGQHMLTVDAAILRPGAGAVAG
jgi:hypothetical protein